MRGAKNFPAKFYVKGISHPIKFYIFGSSGDANNIWGSGKNRSTNKNAAVEKQLLSPICSLCVCKNINDGIQLVFYSFTDCVFGSAQYETYLSVAVCLLVIILVIFS